MSDIQNVLTALIDPGNNDRTVFDPVKLAELAESLRLHGLAQPITVRPMPTGRFQIVAGERRYRASQLLKWETIPAIVRALTDEQASAVMLLENTGRSDLSPIEEARAYQERIDRFSWTLQELSETAGVSQDRIKRRISLLKLVPEAQQLVGCGQLPIGHAEALTPLDNNRQRIALRILNERPELALAGFRAIVSELLSEQSQDGLFDLETFWKAQVQKPELPKRGKHAVTGAPTRKDLPAVVTHPSDSAATVLDRYIAELQSAGHETEAATLGTVYDALVHSNFLSVPHDARLTKA